MAVVNSNTYQDEDDENAGQNTGGSPVKSGVVNLSEAPVAGSDTGTAPTGNTAGISSGTSGTSVNTAQPATAGNQSDQSGSWTNLNDYLNANNGSSNNLGSRVLNTVQQASTQGTGIINSAGQNFQGDVSTGTDVYNPQLSQDALAAPASFLQGPEYTKLVNELTGTYTGPSDWGSSTEAANATQGETDAEQTAGLGLTSQGRQQILNQTSATPYTQGEGSLNEFLLDNNPGQLQPITQAANIGGNLQGQYQQVAQNAGNEVTGAQNTSAATGQQATSDILGGQTALVNQLTNQAQQNAANTTTQGKTIGSLLNTNSAINDNPQTAQGNVQSPPQLTSAEIASLGITPDQYNQLIALNQQVLALGAPGINFGTFYTAPDVSGYTPATEATSSQIANFNALNQLVPGSNEQFLSGATGSPLSTNGTFDYQGAVTALQAQLQAAQEAAQQAQIAQAATNGNGSGGTGSGGATTITSALGGLGGLIEGAKIGSQLYNEIQQLTNQTPAQITQSLQTGTPAQINALTTALGPLIALGPEGLNTLNLAASPTGVTTTTLPTGIMTVQDAGDAGDGAGDIISGETAGQAASDVGQAAETATTAAGLPAVSDASVSDLASLGNLDAGAQAAADQAASNGIDSLADVPTNQLPAAASSVVSNLTAAVGTAAAIYGIYNFINNWQSGNTTGDAMNGASAGAAIGTAFDEFTFGLGTVIGAVIGAAVGALSSAFGGGKQDPETQTLYAYDQAYNSNPAVVTTLTPAASFQILAGVFDGKNPTPGHSTAIEQIFGRENEGNFVSQMTAQINKAIASGAVPNNATATQLYSDVVDPWLASYTGNFGGGQTTAQILPSDTDVNGNQFGNALVGAITSLIGQWQTGQFNGSTPVGVSGQTMGSQLPAYVGVVPQVAAPPPNPATVAPNKGVIVSNQMTPLGATSNIL